ncbi:hypothetical protein LCGC14_1112940 [marine sediment metagenome]|uniref:NlpC/P60 domain-containing protein n=1 Tax=marine sediment metagenome TaxID=412755 RepID=A0A0F9MU47_9ZZZZ
MKAAKFIAAILIFCLTVLIFPIQIFSSPIDEKKDEIVRAKEQIETLNSKFEIAVEDYNEAASNLGGTKQKIRKNKLKLASNLLEIKVKEVAVSDRLRAMYKEGPFSLIFTLFQSKSLFQFFDTVFLVDRITKKDNSLVFELKTAKQRLEITDKKLTVQKTRKEVLVNKVASKKVAINNAMGEKKALMRSVKKDLARLQAEEREKIRKLKEEALRKLREEQQQQNNQTEPAYNGENSGATSDIVEIAKRYLGVRYQWGGTSPERGFDCSGFVQYVYNQIGVTLPRTSREQYRYLSEKGRLIDQAALAPGDLVFYGPGAINDVKMYMGAGYIIGANGGQFIPGEIKILPLHYRSDFYAAGRP